MESLIADFGQNLLLTSFLTTNIAEIRITITVYRAEPGVLVHDIASHCLWKREFFYVGNNLGTVAKHVL